MFKRTYFIRVEVRPTLKDHMVAEGKYTIASGFVESRGFFSPSPIRFREQVLDTVHEEGILDVPKEDLVLTSVSRYS